MSTIPCIAYKAPWTAENYQLQTDFRDIIASPFRTNREKVVDCAKRVFSLIFQTMLSPVRAQYAYWFSGTTRARAGLMEEVAQVWEKNWTAPRGKGEYAAAKVHLTTPDGAKLPPAPWYTYEGKEDLPTVVVLSPFVPASSVKDPADDIPTLAMGTESNWMLQEGKKRQCNFLFIDARRPTMYFDDHLLDASSACEFLRTRGVQKIRLFGYCAGGVTASYTAASYKTRAVIYNTFTHFGTLYRHSSYIRASLQDRIRWPSLLQFFTALLAPLARWNPHIPHSAQPSAALQHKEDELIPSTAQVPGALMLSQKKEYPLPPHRGHWALLTECTGTSGKLGSEMAFDLLSLG